MTAGFGSTTASGTRTRAKDNSSVKLEGNIRSRQLYGITHAYLRLGHLVPLKLMEDARLAVFFFMCWLEAWRSSRP